MGRRLLPVRLFVAAFLPPFGPRRSSSDRPDCYTSFGKRVKNFIDEASKWYADAFVHDQPKIENLVNLYAFVSRMRVLSSQRVVENADRVVRIIVETYLAPNKTFSDVKKILDNVEVDPLREFSKACRTEILGRVAL